MSQTDTPAEPIEPIGAITALEKLRDLETSIAHAFKVGNEEIGDAFQSDAESLYSRFPGGRPRILDLARERLEQMGAA